MADDHYAAVPLVDDGKRFSEPLQPVTRLAFFFGPSTIYEGYTSILSVVIFYILLAFMTGIAAIGVFLRSNIDIWIQFSLYIIPIVTVLCSNRFFNSVAFRELLFRCIPSRAMLCSSIPDDDFLSASELADARLSSTTKKRKWLNNMAYKACLYPLFYEVIQWGCYVIIKLQTKDHDFAGNHNIDKVISDKCWLAFYTFFWTVGLYFVGMFTFQYIMVAYIIRRDAIAFMGLFGDSPFLFVKKSHIVKGNLTEKSWFFGFFRFLTGIILMDAIEDDNDFTNFRVYYSSERYRTRSPLSSMIPARSYERRTPSAGDSNFPKERGNTGRNSLPNQITEEESSKMLAHFLADIGEITSYFTPFTTAMLFFSVTNLVTHLCIFALKREKTEIQYVWTLVRTIIWLLMTVRIIVAAARMTNTLGKIMPHVKYLKATGSLYGEDSKWENFLVLADHFKLGEQTYGFPLTLKQIVIVVAFLKMTFLVVLSVMKGLGDYF